VGKEGIKQLDWYGVIYDNEEAVQLMRRLLWRIITRPAYASLQPGRSDVPVKLEAAAGEGDRSMRNF